MDDDGQSQEPQEGQNSPKKPSVGDQTKQTANQMKQIGHLGGKLAGGPGSAAGGSSTGRLGKAGKGLQMLQKASDKADPDTPGGMGDKKAEQKEKENKAWDKKVFETVQRRFQQAQYAGRIAATSGTDAVAWGKLALSILRNKEDRRRLFIILMIILSIALMQFVLFFLIMTSAAGLSAGYSAYKRAQNNQSLLQIQKSAPAAVCNPAPAPCAAPLTAAYTYTITFSFPDAVQDIVITDMVPNNVDFVSSPDKYTLTTTQDIGAGTTTTITWKLSDNTPGYTGIIQPDPATGKVSGTFSFTVNPNAPDTYAINPGATGIALPPPLPAGGAGYLPPSTNDCGGLYAADFAKFRNNGFPQWAQNYGDPVCDFTKAALYEKIKSTEKNSQFVNIWFDTIIKGESGYDPNAWAPPTGLQCSLDCQGAWGLYQMGSSTPPFQPPPAPGKNGVLDRGDVNWPVQTENAIGYNQFIHCSFRYWATAKVYWGLFSC